MPRFLLAALAMLLLGSTQSAIACSRIGSAPTEEELFANATAVFVGHVTRVEEAGVVSLRERLAFPPWFKTEWQPSKAELESLPPFPAVEATFQVVEVFKGQPPADGKIRAPVGNYCTGPILLVASDHVFFLFEGNFVRLNDEVRFAFARLAPTEGPGKGWAGPLLLEKLRKLSKAEAK
jgi:hypothetical protein